MQPGGYAWQNWLGGFALEPKFAVSEMNLTGFQMPANNLATDATDDGHSTFPQFVEGRHVRY